MGFGNGQYQSQAKSATSTWNAGSEGNCRQKPKEKADE